MTARIPLIPLPFTRRAHGESIERAQAFLAEITTRRSVRHFSTDPIPMEALRSCIAAAAQAPSGANKQPWTFVVVTDPELRRRIREGAEEEERAFYEGRANQKWLDDLAPLATDSVKPFLEEAPALIAVFAQRAGPEDEQHYYVQTSVGLACGFLIAALHHAGFVTLTHTPSPMKFLSEILGRPRWEKPYLLLPVGYPAAGCQVPDLPRKRAAEFLVEHGGADGSGS